MSNRRDRFRQYIARLTTGAKLDFDQERQYYVHPPNATSDALLATIELQTSSQHLLVGGIGSGKTMELRVAEHKLNIHGDIHALYVDVSEHQDISTLQPGCLFALAGLSLIKNARIPFDDPSDAEFFTYFARGYIDDYPDPDEPPPDSYVPGAVTPPKPEWPDISSLNVERLANLHRYYQSQGRTFVVLLDALDRVANREALSLLIAQDIAALRYCKIGVVFVAPMRTCTPKTRPREMSDLDYQEIRTCHARASLRMSRSSARCARSTAARDRQTSPASSG